MHLQTYTTNIGSLKINELLRIKLPSKAQNITSKLVPKSQTRQICYLSFEFSVGFGGRLVGSGNGFLVLVGSGLSVLVGGGLGVLVGDVSSPSPGGLGVDVGGWAVRVLVGSRVGVDVSVRDVVAVGDQYRVALGVGVKRS
jgi:hypothetical protein